MAPRDGASEGDRFPDTRWTRVLSARESPEQRRALLEELCAARWRPLYVYARRKGLSPDRAEDVVQGVLVHLIERDFLSRLDPAKGKLRAYLKRALHHYLVNLHEFEAAEKRGGGARTLSLSGIEMEIPVAPADAERAFDREWALDVFESALAALESEYGRGERTGPFAILRQLFRFGDAPPYEELARSHGMTVSQLKSFVHRGRKRFRALLLERVADTVSSRQEAEVELEDLLRALAS